MFNTARLEVREDASYTGSKRDRVVEQSAAGTRVNSAYYGEGNVIEEFMTAATDLFGTNCLLQFEDFNSNDAFPLLETYRERFLCYNDDIQGTAAVTVAGILGAIKLKNPAETDLIGALRKETFLMHGAGSANIGTLSLLQNEGKVPAHQMTVTNSRGIIWVSEDGEHGNFRNEAGETLLTSTGTTVHPPCMRSCYSRTFVCVGGGGGGGGVEHPAGGRTSS